MRPNRLWKLRQWLPVTLAMRPMIRELLAHRDRDLLHAESAWFRGPAVVQYWRSFELLERFAKDKDGLHLPAWARFNKRVGASGDVGIWHETYLVNAGAFECVYSNMPILGLAAAARHVPIGRGSESAAERVKVSV